MLAAPRCIADAARAFADATQTAEGLAEHCLARVASHDQRGAGLHAVLALNPDAPAEARRLDAAGLQGGLQGIPLVIKDNIDLAGLPTTSGCRALAGAMPRRDALLVTRLREAGAVILAKTNLSEFSLEIRSRSSLGGDVRNPFNPSVTAGGSSGGTAAAIAAGYALGGLGTDTGGSIRVPAAFCGLVGLRPTHDLLEMGGVAPCAPSADTVGPMARTVADVALLLDVTCRGLARPVRGPGAPWRVGVLRQAFGADREIVGAMDAALACLASADVQVVDPVRLPEAVLPGAPADVVDFIAYEFGAAFNAYLRTNFAAGAPASLTDVLASGDYLPQHEAMLRRATDGSVGRERYAETLRLRRVLAEALRTLMDTHALDALAYPTVAALPVSLDNPAGGWAPELAACSARPAVTLPVGQATNGVPIGLELLGHRHRDLALLDLAALVERAVERAVGCRPVAALAAG